MVWMEKMKHRYLKTMLLHLSKYLIYILVFPIEWYTQWNMSMTILTLFYAPTRGVFVHHSTCQNCITIILVSDGWIDFKFDVLLHKNGSYIVSDFSCLRMLTFCMSGGVIQLNMFVLRPISLNKRLLDFS